MQDIFCSKRNLKEKFKSIYRVLLKICVYVSKYIYKVMCKKCYMLDTSDSYFQDFFIVILYCLKYNNRWEVLNFLLSGIYVKLIFY